MVSTKLGSNPNRHNLIMRITQSTLIKRTDYKVSCERDKSESTIYILLTWLRRIINTIDISIFCFRKRRFTLLPTQLYFCPILLLRHFNGSHTKKKKTPENKKVKYQDNSLRNFSRKKRMVIRQI